MAFRIVQVLRSLGVLVLVQMLVVPSASARSTGLYFPVTGHHLTDSVGFLRFWREHDGERLLGFPVSEAFQADGGMVQYFTKGRLEQQVDPASGASSVRTGRVGAEYAEVLWRKFAPAPPRPPVAGEQRFAATGHTLRAPFQAFWQAAGGLDFFGAPISEALWEATEQGQRQVQYFERARLERDATMAGSADEIVVGALGWSLAMARGVDLAAVPNVGEALYGPPAAVAPDIGPLNPTVAPTMTPTLVPANPATPTIPRARPPTQPSATPAPRAPKPVASNKLILVNLSDQWMYAFEGKKQVFDAPVSTGRDGMNTPVGTFAIYAKVKVQTMRGTMNGEAWVVPDVPNVMYIVGGVALHGTYWHNRFGSGARLSHGCINLPLRAAAWVYDWAPMGTTVRVVAS